MHVANQMKSQAQYRKTAQAQFLGKYVLLSLLLILIVHSSAEAIDITRAEVQNSLAFVDGRKADKQATITWDGTNVTIASNSGAFSFSAPVPVDCVGTLSDGTDTVEVLVANCTPKRLLKTGQTTCYQTMSPYGTINCSGTGQDGEFQNGAARTYTINADGTITDNFTGLIWEKLTNPNDGSIHDYKNFYDWPAAFKKIADLNVANFAGHNDWRLPNINELHTLVDYSRISAIDPVFNNGVDSFTFEDTYFSSTTDVRQPGNVWAVRFVSSGSIVFGVFKFQPFSGVRAVRGPQ